MKVKFLLDWNGSEVGDELEIEDSDIFQLIPRKIVEPVTTKEQAEIKKQADEIANLKKQLAAKQIDAAPKNKAMGVAKKK